VVDENMKRRYKKRSYHLPLRLPGSGNKNWHSTWEMQTERQPSSGSGNLSKGSRNTPEPLAAT